MIINLGKWKTTINNALCNYAKKHNLKVRMNRFFKTFVEIENNDYFIESYKIENEEIIATFKKVE